MLVISEGMRLGNEMVMEGQGLADIIKGPYPPGNAIHSLQGHELISQNRSTIAGRIENRGSNLLGTTSKHAIIRPGHVSLGRTAIPWLSSIRN